MSNFDALVMALRNLFKRKVRTILTVLGVVIGSTAIIVMTSIGVGVNKSFADQMNNMQDATTIQIYNDSAYSGSKNATVLDDAMIDTIRGIKGVTAVSPTVQMWMNGLTGRYGASFTLIGMDAASMEAFGFRLNEGEFLSPDEPYGVLFGSDLIYQFKTEKERNQYNWTGRGGSAEQKLHINIYRDKIVFSPEWSLLDGNNSNSGSEDNYGDEGGDLGDGGEKPFTPFKPIPVKGVGVLDGSLRYDAASSAFMDVKTVAKIDKEYREWQRKQYGGTQQQTQGYPQAMVRCDSIDVVSQVAKELNTYGFDYVYNPTEFVDQLKEMLSTLQIMLVAIGAVSLFVAAIGITNTMVMSIYERTREIGVMKVIGASLNDIRRLFLFEASLIGFLGGVLGVGLSLLVSYVMNHMQISFLEQVTGMVGGNISVIPLWLAGLAMGFSTLIGLVSGYLPARRATKLSALSALRTQ
ncbi:ABC transporter permease [Clostridia bacterium]|nr:ABC transporter permease [Clostridia bacterium]